MRVFTALAIVLLLQACKHPLEIEGEGDIIDLNASGHGCTLEQFQAADVACTENETFGAYFVKYEGVPRAGWKFIRWEGPCGPTSEPPYCQFELPAASVEAWDEVYSDVPIPPTIAVFEQEWAAAALSLSFEQVKAFQFSWDVVSSADHYNLLENPDGLSGFTQVATVAAGTQTVNHVVPLYARVNADYILQTCSSADDSVCADSNTVSVSDTLVGSIGYFKASNTGGGDDFGSAVALSDDGNTLAVSAGGEASNATGIGGNQFNNFLGLSGAVYVFTRSGSTWSQQAYIKASNTEKFDQFGYAIALSGDGNTLAVGANKEGSNATGINGHQINNSAPSSGAVYVFTRSGSTWSQQAYIKASNTDTFDDFGAGIALSGDGNTLAVGASREDSNATGIDGDQTDNSASFLDSGAAYVFTRSVSTWSQQAYIKASNTGSNDLFGAATALSDDGNTLAVRALGEASNATGIGGNQTNNSATSAGAVYVFTRSGSNWSQQAYIKASNTDTLDDFGAGMALSGDGNTLAVGASREDSTATGIDGDQTDDSDGDQTDDSASFLDSGAAYVFTRGGSSWSQQAYIKASNTGKGDNFGFAIALSGDGDTLTVGAIFESSSATGIGGDQNSNLGIPIGAAYVFARSGSSWSQQAYIKASSNTVGPDFFGRVVALSGNGGTLAVSAGKEDSSATGIGGDQLDNSATNSGAVYLY